MEHTSKLCTWRNDIKFIGKFLDRCRSIFCYIRIHYFKRVKKLFLCNTFIKFNEDSRQAFGKILDLYKNNAPRSEIMDAVIPWVFSDKFTTPELRAFIHEAVAADPLWQTKEDYERQLNALNAFDSSQWIENITTPAVVIGSRDDRTALPKESELLARKIRADLEILEGGHASAVEQGVLFSEILINQARASCSCQM